MPSLIEELQRDALDRTVPVADLLRRAKVVATKLDLPEFLEWVNGELNGFPGEVPAYRVIAGQVQGQNPVRGWVPVGFASQDQHDRLSQRAVGSTAAELDRLVSEANDHLGMSFPPQLEASLRKATGAQVPFMLVISKSQIAGILDTIRTTILDWSLKLEKAGVKGDGMSFSEKEKAVAHSAPVQITIESAQNIAGNFGTVTGNVSINQTVGVDLKGVADLLAQIDKLLTAAGLGADVEKRTAEAVSALKEALKNPAPEPGKVNGLLKSLRTIMEGAAGNVVAEGIIAKIGVLTGASFGG